MAKFQGPVSRDLQINWAAWR